MITLPDVGISKVIGLLEVLHDHKGEAETVKLADELALNVETFLPVVEAGVLLGLITVSGGKIKLTESGIKIVNSKIIDRKVHIRERIIVLEPFKRISEIIKSKKTGRVSKKSILKLLRAELPKEQADKTLAKIIEWGRHADLIGYESDSDELYLAVVENK